MSEPLTGPALEIQRRLEAGQPIDRITEAGRWKRSWLREDVLAVDRYRQQFTQRQEAEDDRIEAFAHWRTKDTRVPEHGTRREYSRGCRCDPCTEAKRKYQREWRQGRQGGAA